MQDSTSHQSTHSQTIKDLALIACISQDYGLGKDGKLLWNIPEDMRFFREATTGGTVVMGRKTYESIGRPLPKRENIILSRASNITPANSDPSTSLKVFQDQLTLDQYLSSIQTPVFIIGGATLYNIYINIADKLYLTEVQAIKAADTYFPNFDKTLFSRKVLKTGEHTEHTPSGDQVIKYEIVEYTRKPTKE